MGKYFDIDETQRYHSIKELKQKEGFSRTLNFTEMFAVLGEQLREKGLQPHLYFDGSGFEILPAHKKFMQRRGCHKDIPSKRAYQYMAWCEGKEIDAAPPQNDYCR